MTCFQGIATAILLTVAAGTSLQPPKTVQLSLRHEINHPQVRPLDLDLRWQFAEVLAMHPSGEKFAVLTPQPVEETLRTRASAERSERTFRLEWVHLANASRGAGIELAYRAEHNPGRGEPEAFGFSLSPSGNLLCTSAGLTS